MTDPIVLAITGASGSIYAVRLLQVLHRRGCRVQMTMSHAAALVLDRELGIQINLHAFEAAPLLTYVSPLDPARWTSTYSDEVGEVGEIRYYHSNDFMSPIASGSHVTRGMVVCPCSGGTMSGIVHASSDNLIVRAADVHLKEHRKLILVPRETPLSVFQLENMQRAAAAGAVVLPASPGWYHGVASIIDLVDFVVARILDHLGIPHHLMQRWGEEQTENRSEACR